MDVKIHTQGIRGSGIAEEGEHPSALFGAILELDGEIVENVFKIELSFEEGFAEVKVIFRPSTVEVVHHSKGSWPGVQESYRDRVVARDACGKVIAAKS